MKYFFFIISVFIFLSCLNSCWISKEEKRLYKNSKVIRDSKPILTASHESTMSGFTITIRENNYFHLYHGVAAWKGYKAGTWKAMKDTIHLNYYYNNNMGNFKNYIIINKDSTYIFMPHIYEDSVYHYPLRCHTTFN